MGSAREPDQEFHSWSAVEKAFQLAPVRAGSSKSDPAAVATQMATESIALIHQIVAGAEKGKARTRRAVHSTES